MDDPLHILGLDFKVSAGPCSRVFRLFRRRRKSENLRKELESDLSPISAEYQAIPARNMQEHARRINTIYN